MELSLKEKESIKEFSNLAEKYYGGFWGFYFKNSYRKALNLAKPYLGSGRSILDVGCGPGGLEKLLSRLVSGSKIIGIDISPKVIEVAQKSINNDDNKQNNEIIFIVSQASIIPYPDNFFDIIFCLNSFHHFPDQVGFVREANRMLRPGGVLVLLDNINDNVIRKCWIKILNLCFGEKEVEYHSRKEIREFLLSNMFGLIDQKTFFLFTSFFICKKAKLGL